MTLYRGEVAAVIGPNGVGKTTFLKTLLHQLAPLSGGVPARRAVKLGYFAQAHELLKPENSILDELLIGAQYADQRGAQLSGDVPVHRATMCSAR